jgi:DNA-binding CsgD family transcriptional regulator
VEAVSSRNARHPDRIPAPPKRFYLLTDGPINANARMLSLIGDIYDTTFDQALWSETLQRIVDYTGAHSSGLVTKSSSDVVRVTHHVGCKPHFLQTYLDHYGQFDPTHAIRLFDVGKIHSTEDWVPIEEFRKGQFYQEWARPQRLEDAASVLLENNADGFSYFCLMKSGGLVDDDLRRMLVPIVPHLLRAVLIGQILHQQTRIASPIEHTLDELRAAMFLLDGTGSITHTNQSGKDILERKDFLRNEQGRLVAIDPQLNRILREAAAASILGDGATRSESIALPFIAQDGERFVGHLLPLTAGRRRKTGIAYDATAVLFVTRASLDSMAASDLIKKIFKLTPAEARVLLAVVELGSVAETSRNLDIAESTVKTHLGRIFTKTDTKRQADLVKLVAAFSSPVRS